jgi:acetolactate synthase-1/2/3 large subunit
MMQMTGADLIVKLLERQGISTIAGVPGGAALPMYDALSKSETDPPRAVPPRAGRRLHRPGHGPVSGRPEVCLASSGPARPT